MIPYVGIQRQYQNLRQEILDATDQVYSSGQVMNGEFTLRFESRIADRCGRDYAVAVNSGSQALLFAHMHLKGKNLIPGLSFIATRNSVKMAGNDYAYCDVGATGSMNVDHAIHALTNNPNHPIKNLVAVNLYGNMFDFDRLSSALFLQGIDNINIIEDAAQSFGASLNGKPSGSFGKLSILSFDPMKNLNNYGSGGMVLTNSFEVFVAAQNFRDNGKYTDYFSHGTNSRMSEADCAQLLVKLNYFDDWQLRRRDIARYYTENIPHDIVRPLPITDGCEPSWHKYTLTVDINRMTIPVLAEYLKQVGIETKVHYRPSIAWYDGEIGTTHMANLLANTTISLPIYPELTDAEVEHIVESIKRICSAY